MKLFLPYVTKEVNLFERHVVTVKEVKRYVNLFWDSKAFANVDLQFHRIHSTDPIDDNTLTAAWNCTKMKSIIIGRKVWSSLTT